MIGPEKLQPDQILRDSWTMEQNVRFQRGICPENFDQKLDQIQNGRLVAIIKFSMHNFLQTLPDRSIFPHKARCSRGRRTRPC